MRVARDVAGCQPRLGQQLVEHHAGATAQSPVRKTCGPGGQILQAAQAERVAPRHHQALGALRKADDLVLARLQQGFVGALRQRLARGVLQGVEACQYAAPLVQRADRVHAAGEADVQVQLAQACRVRAQGGQGVVVACVERQHMGGRVERHCEGAFQVGAQGVDLGAQAGLRLAFGPHQLGAKFRQPRRLAFFPDDQLVAQFVLPALEFAPHVAVGQPQRAGRRRDRALRVHGLQQVDQRVADQGFAGIAGECVVELDPMHGGTYRRELIGCLRYLIPPDCPPFAPCPPSLKAPPRHWR